LFQTLWVAEEELLRIETMGATIQGILIACDLSEHTRDLLSYGALLAEKNSGRMVLVHVIETCEPSLFNRIAGIGRLFRNQPPTRVAMALLRKRRYLEMERLVKEMKISPWVERRIVLTGIPHREILKQAEQSQIDLIIAGAGHCRSIATKTIGLTASQILRNSRVPVITMPIHSKPCQTSAPQNTVDRPAA
jgi:nucleotide-binding universal stress UspA family protein